MTDIPSFRERLHLDEARGEWLDGPRRYLMLRPDTLMGLFLALAPDARLQALQALDGAVYRQGSGSARAYLTQGGGDLPALLATMEATAPQLGWGVWRFQPGPDALRLEVRNSPFAHGYGASDQPVCHAIAGMLRGVAEMWFGRPCEAHELRCEARGAEVCAFKATPVDT